MEKYFYFKVVTSDGKLRYGFTKGKNFNADRNIGRVNDVVVSWREISKDEYDRFVKN